MHYMATPEEKAEIGRLMLELSDIKRQLDAKRVGWGRQKERIREVGSGRIHDDAQWPTPDEYHSSRREIADLENHAPDPGGPQRPYDPARYL